MDRHGNYLDTLSPIFIPFVDSNQSVATSLISSEPSSISPHRLTMLPEPTE
jgi:hypothetical protein